VARFPVKVADGARELAARDARLAVYVEQIGPPDLRRGRPRRGHFAELARMICYQQLAGRAAAAIHGRFELLFDGEPSPEAVLARSDDELRGVGLSAAKVASIRDLAGKTLDGLVELDRMGRLADDTVVRELTLVRGIGEWTAHMFLMFQLGRLDVWPTLDLGVRNGYGRIFGVDPAPTAKELAPLGDPFRPYRSLVAWYCWRAVDTVTPG
jgi:DNA-3-methyladenine glycosylase II